MSVKLGPCFLRYNPTVSDSANGITWYTFSLCCWILNFCCLLFYHDLIEMGFIYLLFRKLEILLKFMKLWILLYDLVEEVGSSIYWLLSTIFSNQPSFRNSSLFGWRVLVSIEKLKISHVLWESVLFWILIVCYRVVSSALCEIRPIFSKLVRLGLVFCILYSNKNANWFSLLCCFRCHWETSSSKFKSC